MKPDRNLVRAGAMLAVVLGVAVASRWLGNSREAPHALTSYPGIEVDPAFSADGLQVAFSWNGAVGDNFDIYTRPVGGGEPVRLTKNPLRDFAPSWSPNGRWIAFLRLPHKMGNGGVGVYVVPGAGGEERLVLPSSVPYADPRLGARKPGWTPDGRGLVVTTRSADAYSTGLSIVWVETGESLPLTTPPPVFYGDREGVISPDGKMLAFLRSPAYNIQDIHLLELGEDYRPRGEPRRLTNTGCCINTFVWSADGRELEYVLEQNSSGELWSVSTSNGGAPRKIRTLGPLGRGVTLSSRGDRLAYTDHSLEEDIWRLDLERAGEVKPERFLSSGRVDLNPRISPDGARVAFASSRAGAMQIFVCDNTGQNVAQLTGLSSSLTGSPRWSPDGREIAFDARLDGNSDIYVVPSTGGKTRRLTSDPSPEYNPSWSRDGKWIYFSSNRSGQRQIWKRNSDGSGDDLQVTREGGWAGFEAVDGRSLYYTKAFRNTGIWRMPVAGGAETRVVQVLNQLNNFEVTAGGIYHQTSEIDRPEITIWFHRFSTGKSELVQKADKWSGQGMAVSPDGRWLLFTEVEERGGNLWMLENLR